MVSSILMLCKSRSGRALNIDDWLFMLLLAGSWFSRAVTGLNPATPGLGGRDRHPGSDRSPTLSLGEDRQIKAVA